MEVIWNSDDSSFADVLVSTGPDGAVFSRDARSRSARLLADGVDRVRLCKLAAPLASLLRTSRFGPPEPLPGSELWFGPAPTDPEAVVAAGMGGAS